MLKALNEFMGRSTVDPTVRQSYRAGMIKQILLECGFPAGVAQRLSKLSAQNFNAYLNKVHSYVADELAANTVPDHPWPSDGLKKAVRQLADKDEAA